MRRVMLYVAAVAICGSARGEERFEINARVDANLLSKPLIVANRCYPELGVDREDVIRLNKARQGIIDWQTMQAAVEQLMDERARQLHRKYTFQFLVGRGELLEALRYAEIRIDTEDQEELLGEVKKLKEEFNSQHLANVMSICIEALEPVIKRDELETAVGELHVFREPSLRTPPDTEPFEFDTLSLDLLRSKHVQLELGLNAGQLAKLQRVMKRWQLDLIPELDGEDDHVLRENEAKLMTQLADVFREAQVQRLRQLMLQRVLSWYQTRAAIRQLGLTPTLGQRERLRNHEYGLYGEVSAAKQLLGFQLFFPLLAEHVHHAQLKDLSTPPFIPCDHNGQMPQMKYGVFTKLAGHKKTPKNPRRER